MALLVCLVVVAMVMLIAAPGTEDASPSLADRSSVGDRVEAAASPESADNPTGASVVEPPVVLVDGDRDLAESETADSSSDDSALTATSTPANTTSTVVNGVTSTTAAAAAANPSVGSSTSSAATTTSASGPVSTAAAESGTTVRPRQQRNFGFSPGGWFPDEPDSALLADLDRMVEAGASWIRIDFDWSEIERNEGTYHWHRTDRVVDAANARGLRVLGILNETPSWARPGGSSSQTPPSDAGEFADFAADAVARYRSRGVVAWELWNEPNLALFWRPRPDPAAYARLAIPAASAMRAVDSRVVIISGGLAPAADESDGSGISPSTFVTDMIGAGGDIFDGYGIHPYSYPARPIDPSTAAWNPFNNLPQFRSLLRSLGQGGKPIWLTEYGAPTGTSSRAVSEAEQAAQLSEALEAAHGWGWAGPIFLYSHRDERVAPGDFQANFGLMRNDGTPKRAWSDLMAKTGR